MKSNKKFGAFSVLTLALFACLNNAVANVVVSGTRQIYPSKEREITVQLTNQGTKPALVQAWVDNGDPKIDPDKSNAPFLVMPVLSRIDPMKGQALRISFVGEKTTLPVDRESMYWINVLDIPAVDKTAEKTNSLQLAFRSRFKLLYRPEGLKGSVESSAKELRWTLLPVNGGYVMRASNSGAFNVSVDGIEIEAGGKKIRSVSGGVIKPFGAFDFPLKAEAITISHPVRVNYQWLNDYGAIQKESVILGR